MTTIFITRHPGAKTWAEREGFRIDHVLDHLDINTVNSGDNILGILPVHLAASVCARGAHYFHLSLQTPPQRRGGELTLEEMYRYGVRLDEYWVQRLAGC